MCKPWLEPRPSQSQSQAKFSPKPWLEPGQAKARPRPRGLALAWEKWSQGQEKPGQSHGLRPKPSQHITRALDQATKDVYRLPGCLSNVSNPFLICKNMTRAQMRRDRTEHQGRLLIVVKLRSDLVEYVLQYSICILVTYTLQRTCFRSKQTRHQLYSLVLYESLSAWLFSVVLSMLTYVGWDLEVYMRTCLHQEVMNQPKPYNIVRHPSWVSGTRKVLIMVEAVVGDRWNSRNIVDLSWSHYM